MRGMGWNVARIGSLPVAGWRERGPTGRARRLSDEESGLDPALLRGAWRSGARPSEASASWLPGPFICQYFMRLEATNSATSPSLDAHLTTALLSVIFAAIWSVPYIWRPFDRNRRAIT